MIDLTVLFLIVLIYASVLVLYFQDYFDVNEDHSVRGVLIGAALAFFFSDWIRENFISSILIGAVLLFYYQLNQIKAIMDSIRAVLEEDRRKRYKVTDEELSLETGAMTDNEVMNYKQIKEKKKQKRARAEKIEQMNDDARIFKLYIVRPFWILLISIPLFLFCYVISSERTLLQSFRAIIELVEQLL